MNRIYQLSALVLFFIFSNITFAGNNPTGGLTLGVVSQTNSDCNGLDNGSATVMATGGLAPYVYSWSPSVSTDSIAMGLAAGSYTVSVIDANLDSTGLVITITETYPILFGVDSMSLYGTYNLACYGDANAWANTSASGGLISGWDSVTFNYTGAQQIFVVPLGISSVDFKVWGAQGGANWVNNDNYGGYASGTMAVTPGETLYVYVGQQPNGIAGGWNGGGNGESAGQGGGGATDIRVGGTTYSDRVIVAGGGGGAGYWSSQHVVGGVGGGLTGGNGYRGAPSTEGGDGGTQSSSGDGTCVSLNNPICAGGFGFGGSPSGCGCEGYGGGGGWYGGAGSGNCRGGGGGSGYLDPVLTSTAFVSGTQAGNGMAIISWFGANTYTWDWSNGDTTQNISNLAAGVYNVMLTDQFGCVASDSITITQPTEVNLLFNTTNVDCFGNDNGAIDLTISGGTPGYTSYWITTMDSTEDINGLPPGFYNVMVTDAQGCIMSDSIEIMEPGILSISASVTNESFGSDGSIDITVSGGTPGFTYLWSNSQTTEDITGLTAGNYTITVTDFNGCSDTLVVTVLSTVGLESNSIEGFKMYPNPAEQYLVIDFSNAEIGDNKIQIMDLTGKIIYSRNIQNNGATAVTIDVSEFASGSYIVSVVSNKSRKSETLFIAR